jgi:hypothetical protein
MFAKLIRMLFGGGKKPAEPLIPPTVPNPVSPVTPEVPALASPPAPKEQPKSPTQENQRGKGKGKDRNKGRMPQSQPAPVAEPSSVKSAAPELAAAAAEPVFTPAVEPIRAVTEALAAAVATEKPKVANESKSSDDLRSAAFSATRIPQGVSAEVLCGISPGMTAAEIESRLALLYRRHNRAASSLDETMREEAETMLEAIAAVRERSARKA